MAKIVTSYSNLARGKLDHDIMGRFDLSIYNTGADAILNFITDLKGNGKYRTGREHLFEFQDCGFIEFKFNKQQSYVCVLFANTMRFISYDSSGNVGWVLDGGASILEVATPWDLAESKLISKTQSFTQNKDSMIIAHKDYPPQQLKRLSANSFTLQAAPRRHDPFAATFEASKAITSIALGNNPSVTCNAHGYTTGDQIKITGVVGMEEINEYVVTVTVTSANAYTINIDTTKFTAYTSGGGAEKVLTGSYPARCHYHKARLYYARTSSDITTVWGSEPALYDYFEIPETILATSALQLELSEIAQEIEWMISGSNSLIVGAGDGIVAINGGQVGDKITGESVEATLASEEGCNSAPPFRKDGFIFYTSLNGRKLHYLSYDLLTETFVTPDANNLSYDITNGVIVKSRGVKNRDDIVYTIGEDGRLVTLNFNKAESIVAGWHEQTSVGTVEDIASITDNEGNPKLFLLSADGGSYKIQVLSEFVEFQRRDEFFTEGAEVSDADDEAYARYTAELLKRCNYLDDSSEVSNLKSTTITYDSGAGTVTDASGPFSSGDVGKHIVYKTITGYESGRFEITAYNSATEVEVDVLQEPTSLSFSSWYLTFETITGLSRFEGESVGVVVDGGYLDNVVVVGGSISLGEQYAHARVGYTYRGYIKSFSLGFQIKAENTQTTLKSIVAAGIRCVQSAGGKFGSSPYALEDVQEMKQGTYNYLPPATIDGTKYISYTDDSEVDKYWYAVQDEPLPFNIAAIMIDAEYAIDR